MSTVELLFLLLALLGSGFYSGMETGVVSVNRLRLQHLVRRNVKGATIIHDFLAKPDHLLGTTLVGTNICNVAVSVALAGMAVTAWGARGLWIASLGSTILLLIFGEYLPKAWFRSYPAYRVVPFASLLKWSGYLFYPISAGVIWLARLLIPAPSGSEGEQQFITREEFKYLAREGEQTGTLSPEERRMIHSVLELTRKTCRDVMIPRERMITASPDTPAEALIERMREQHISRIPIYDDKSKAFIGIVHILDVLTVDPTAGKSARDFVRPPQYVAGHTPADRILPRMRLTRQPMALVTDDKAHVIGLVTMEDLLEEIVGKL